MRLTIILTAALVCDAFGHPMPAIKGWGGFFLSLALLILALQDWREVDRKS